MAPANLPPVLAPIGDQTVDEGVELRLPLTASDPDVGQLLAFAIAGLPLGDNHTPDTHHLFQSFSQTGAGAGTAELRWAFGEEVGPGDYAVTFTVFDDGDPSLSDSETINIHVNEVNSAPLLVPIGDDSFVTSDPVSFTAQAIDFDDPTDTLTFSLAGAPSGAVIDPATGAFEWTPTLEQVAAGSHTFTVRVTDAGGLFDEETLTLGFQTTANSPPRFINNLPPFNQVGELELLVFQLGASGVDGNPPITVEGLPSGARLASSGADEVTGVWYQSIVWRPTCEQSGIYEVTFRASDGQGGTDRQSVVIFVNDTIYETPEVEGPGPVFSVMGSIEGKVHQLIEGQPGSGFPPIEELTDADRAALLAAVDQLPNLFAEIQVVRLTALIGLLDDILTREGLSPQEVSRLEEVRDLSLGILPCVQGHGDALPPSIVLGGSASAENDGQTQQFTWNSTDASGLSSVSVTVTKDGNPVFTSTAAIGTYNFDAQGLGNYAIEITATDTGSLTSTASRSAAVSDDDTAAPSIVLGGSSGEENDGQPQQFTWNASDFSGLSSVSVTVTQDGNEVFTSSAASGTFDFDSLGLGTFVLTVTATDADSDWNGDSLTASVSSSTTVSDDDTQGPVIVLGGSSGTESESQTQEFNWDVSDDSGLSALEVVVTQDTGGGPVEIYRTEDTGQAVSSFDFDSYGVGTFEITVTATDGDDDWSGDYSESSATETVAVTAGNRPPVLTVPGPFTVDECQTLTFQVSATDPDGDPLTFSVDMLPTDATFDPATLTYNSTTQTWSQTFTWTPCCDQAGAYSVSFLVEDGHGGTDTGEVQIDVTDVPAQQHIEAISEQVAGLSELSQGQRNALLTKLDNASASLDLGNTRAAVGQLQAFVNQVDALLNRPGLTEPTKEELREIQQKVAELLVCLQAPAAQPQLVSIRYVDPRFIPRQQRGPYGELSQDNPATMGGGWRIFPDAVGSVVNNVVTGNNVPHNLVRIRAVVENANANTVVTFRSFDVDDPSADRTIDPNDPVVGGVNTPRGGDNRGELQQTAQYNHPASSSQPGTTDTDGYAGMLRPVGGAFPAPIHGMVRPGGYTVQVTVQRVRGQWIAEVELAVSYAPGDNFRVAASIGESRTDAAQPRKVGNLDRATDVPTTGAIPNFDGLVTEQLSVWRHVHVEYDRMLPTDGDNYSAETVGMPVAVPGMPGQFTVTVNLTPRPYQLDARTGQIVIPFEHRQFENGFLALSTGHTYQVIGSTMVAGNPTRAQLTITAGRPPVVLPFRPTPGTVYDDDWTLRGGKLVPRVDPFTFATQAEVFALMQASPDVAINRYAAAYIQPEYVQLQPFNTARAIGKEGMKDNPIRPLSHFNSGLSAPGDPLNPAAHWDLLDIHQGSGLSRTDLYWTVYVATGYQSDGRADGDPSFDRITETGQKWGQGLTVNRLAPLNFNTKLSKSILFVETIRDVIDFADPVDNHFNITAKIMLARAAVHEVGHQFTLVDPAVGGDGQGHRSGGNLMNSEPLFFHDSIYTFDPQDVVELRLARESP